MRSLSIDSPAKLNLFLRVLGKRPDGYHELCTLFHRISLQDTLKLEKRSEGFRLICSHPEVPQKGNLITRAFDLLKKDYPFQGGVTARLTKRIPVGGGLGGGSSNAAAFLLGMNRLYRLGLSRQALASLGRELGADVPFFLSEARHALGKGRGDEIRPLRFKRKLGFILLPDHGGLSTRRVYRRLRWGRRRRSLTEVSRTVRMTSAFLEQGRLAEAVPFLVNDLRESAETLRPSLKHRRRIASELHLGACQMSGSGPTLFVLFISPTQAGKAFSRFRRHSSFKRAILCQTL